jgi:hypothetical protein
MTRIKAARVLLVLVLSLTACAGTRLAAPTAADRGLIFGHISAQRITVMTVYLHQPGHVYAVPLNNPKARVDAQGFFLLANAEPGRYYFAGFSDGVHNYWLADKSPTDGAVELAPGGAALMGSFEIVSASGGWENSRQFLLRPQARPSRQDLQSELSTRVREGPWADRLDKLTP